MSSISEIPFREKVEKTQSFLRLGLMAITCLIATLLICLLHLNNQLSNASASQGLLELIPAEKKLGKVPILSVLPFTFQLRNSSNKTINITGLHPACNCTSVRMQESILQPGQKSQIEGTIATGSQTGELLSKILIEYKNQDEKKEALMAVISGNCVKVIDVVNQVNLGTISPDQKPSSVEIPIKRGDADLIWDDLRIVDKSNISTLSYKGGSWLLTVHPERIDSSAEYGMFKERVELQAWDTPNNKMVHAETLYLLWKNECPGLPLIPSSAYIGNPVENEMVSLKIPNPKLPIKIESYKTIPPMPLKLCVKNDDENSYLIFTVMPNTKDKSVRFSGYALVKIFVGEALRKVRIPIIGN